MNKQAWWMSAVVVASLAVAIGCGSKKSSNNMADAGDAGGGKAGSSGNMKTPDAGGTGDAAMTMTAAPVPCGSMMCQQPANPLAALGGMAGGLGGAAAGLGGAAPMAAACCLDAATGTCGISAGAGMTCNKMAVPDTRCPAPNLGAIAGLAGGLGGGGGGIPMSGCCTDDGMCGQDGSAFGNGCVENAAAAQMISAIPLIGMFIMIPPPQKCAGGSGNDAGQMTGTGGTTGGGNDAGH